MPLPSGVFWGVSFRSLQAVAIAAAAASSTTPFSTPHAASAGPG